MKRTQILHSIHGWAGFGFEKAGYRFEIRKEAGYSLGLWRMEFRKPSRGRQPRRLVFIPGFGDTSLSWTIVLGLLQPVLRVKFDELVLMDFPGFNGFLSKETCFESLDLMWKATDQALDELRPDVVVGHSLGGWIGGHYACRPADDGEKKWPGPKQYILISPSGVFGNKRETDTWEKVFRTAMDQGFVSIRERMFKKEPYFMQFVLKDLEGFSTRPDVRKFMSSFDHRHRLEGLLKNVDSKIVLVWGDHDRLVPTTWYRAWLKHLDPKRAMAVLINDAGHSPQFEKPAVTAALLGQLLLGQTPHELGSKWWTVCKR